MPQPPVTDGNEVQQWGIKHLSQQGYRPNASAHFLPGNTDTATTIQIILFHIDCFFTIIICLVLYHHYLVFRPSEIS